MKKQTFLLLSAAFTLCFVGTEVVAQGMPAHMRAPQSGMSQQRPGGPQGGRPSPFGRGPQGGMPPQMPQEGMPPQMQQGGPQGAMPQGAIQLNMPDANTPNLDALLGLQEEKEPTIEERILKIEKLRKKLAGLRTEIDELHSFEELNPVTLTAEAIEAAIKFEEDKKKKEQEQIEDLRKKREAVRNAAPEAL